MSGYILLDEYSKELSECLNQDMANESANKAKAKLYISTYSQNQAKPHFKIEINNDSCHFDLVTGAAMDEMSENIAKYGKSIQKFYKSKKSWLCDIYNDNLPAKAPISARITL